ncbi:DUF5709 domain-containing protein [Streptomyces sp. RB6PN25]|uniref:DUF5709 domain-containing protein n=1 Tax=Streptomyces humicola TaxID=2953240 RepID=A0ABT1Q168_9ACTN|nr:DUF5709 domain-containing protein [Streptomyces humicola]MCQ4083681.1 DUF5709 domain-containing protein [Streptomyces humicola]
MSENATGDVVYQPDRTEVQDDAGLLDPQDTLEDRGLENALDEGYSPPERPYGLDHWGLSPEEQPRAEPLDARLAHEVPENAAPLGDGLGDTLDTDGELLDDAVGTRRAGRLVARYDESYPGRGNDVFASDVGIDGGAASAEEAAVHIIPDSEDFEANQ